MRAFGPARPEDFRWWTGVSKERATAALGSVETVEVGECYLLPGADCEDFEAVEAPEQGSVDLLPKWDCYTMGYPPDGRQRFVRPEARARVYNEAGDGLGVVLVDGEAVAALLGARSVSLAQISCIGGGSTQARVSPLGYTFSAMLGVLLILCGYLLGSVPTGLLVGRAFGVDVLKEGSGNIGMANVLRSAGKWPAALTMLGDMLKGFSPVVLARALTDNGWIIAAVALAAVIGACWSVFLGFKGGKAVATGAGTTIGLAPPVGLVLFALWWTVALTSRYTSLAAIVLMIVSPFAFLLTGQPLPYVIYTVVGGAVVLWRHRENAKALLAGRERKFGERVRKKRAR